MVQNPPKPRGRPRSFDETGALEKATQVFWSKGYDGVTIDDLVAGMGVGRPSLYAVFGDKRAIFLRVLKAYAEAKGARAAKALLRHRSLRDSIAGFLRFAVESATEKGSARGLPSDLRRAACGRCRGPEVPATRGRGRRGAGGRSIPGRDHCRRNPVRLSCGRTRDPSHGFCPWPYDACADRHAAQDAPQEMPRKRPTWCSCRGASDGLSETIH